ncbi:hypothetical protein [Parendozoicomonas haliclonae]|uniref:Uncharacterized protein n=1 Tax=Parendozoicomonas haliclonae TaxID=1960125 RepID=A0A1X7AGQ8_9GAMM|nr:hypothetical protein [Parendozoicomonas haliclonae]SMA40616.1 hypothetical protein EHSB41UT_01213 [Parendozoicomonas haliclonae]
MFSPHLKSWKALIAAASLGFLATSATADIKIGDSKSTRFGKGESVTTNWSTLHSNPLDNTYQETVRVMSVCVNGRSFVVSMGMAGIWDTSNNAGAGAGGGTGIVQVFDTDASGNMVPVTCK